MDRRSEKITDHYLNAFIKDTIKHLKNKIFQGKKKCGHAEADWKSFEKDWTSHEMYIGDLIKID